MFKVTQIINSLHFFSDFNHNLLEHIEED